MTDLHHFGCICGQCVREYPRPVSHEDLEAESAVVMKALAREMEKVRDQLYHLNKTHTVALMAVKLYATNPVTTMPDATSCAKNLYHEVQKTLRKE